jgi:hypothetical protein
MTKQIKATVQLIRDDETTWLSLASGTRTVLLNLANLTSGPMNRKTILEWAAAEFNRPEVVNENEQLEAELYDLTVQLWYRLMPESAKHGGHPGPSGPAGNDEWTPRRGYLEGAITQLKQVLVNTPCS